MVVISAEGHRPKMFLPKQPLDFLIAHHANQEDLEALRAKCANIVVTSNKDFVSDFLRVINVGPAKRRERKRSPMPGALWKFSF
jgi:hypothetical protein